MAPAASDLDLENRELCPDGACIGVLDDKGKCKVCGQGAAAPAEADRDEEEADELPAKPEAAEEPEERDESLGAPDLDDRELCPDGSCIGLLGKDGRCKVCGKRRGQTG